MLFRLSRFTCYSTNSTLSLLNQSKHVPAYLPVAELSIAEEVSGREAEKDVREMEGVE